jgi:ribonuclease P protein component
MLKKINRLDKRSVDKVFKKGFYLNSLFLTFKFLKTNTPSFRISVVVPKSTNKLAVKRNKLKRMVYDIIKKNIDDSLKGVWGVFIFKKEPDNLLVLENEIKKLFSLVD